MFNKVEAVVHRSRTWRRSLLALAASLAALAPALGTGSPGAGASTPDSTPAAAAGQFFSDILSSHWRAAAQLVDPGSQASFLRTATSAGNPLAPGPGHFAVTGTRFVRKGSTRGVVTVTVTNRSNHHTQTVPLPVVQVHGKWYADWSVLAPGIAAATEADDRAAQSNLTNAITAAKALYINTSSYQGTPAMIQQLASTLPEFHFTAGPATGSGTVLSVVSAPQDLVLVAHSATGTCWYANDNEGSAAVAGRPAGLTYSKSTGVPCTAAQVPTSLHWSDNYPG